MIIYGTYATKKTLSQGLFRCPRCMGEQPFKHVRVYAKLHVFFIPIMTLGPRDEYVECQECGGVFQTHVLKPRAQHVLEHGLFNGNDVPLEVDENDSARQPAPPGSALADLQKALDPDRRDGHG